MRPVVLLFLVIVCSVAYPPSACGSGPLIQTTADGCFSLQIAKGSGGGSTQVMRLLSEAEKRFLSFTGFVPSDYPPVIVCLHADDSSQRGLPSMRVDALEGGIPRIQVDLSDRKARGMLDSEKRLLIEALLLRELYEGKAPKVGETIPASPRWISHGLARLCFENSAKTTMQASYLQGGTPPEIDAFLVEREPGEESRLLLDNYNERAACLLRAGLLPNGGAAFRKWIGHDEKGGVNFMKSQFPSGWDKHRVERDWLLMMAATSRDGNNSTGSLSSEETLRNYDEITKGLPKDQVLFLKSLKESGWEYKSQEWISRLKALHLRANPLIVPLIDETMIFVQSARRLSSKKLAEQLGKLSQDRAELLGRSRKIDAYLDWYEAAKVPLPSGLYDSLLHASESRLRKGPIGRYLDNVEERGW